MSSADSNGKEQSVSIEVLEERVTRWRDADDRRLRELEAAVKEREDSSEGMRTRVNAVDAKIDKHEQVCAARWGELVGSLKGLKIGGALASFLITVGLVVLGFVLHK